MIDVDYRRVDEASGDGELELWRFVHNTIVPAHRLGVEDVRERAGRHHLELAYVDGVLVGNSTVRPPEGDTDTATVIVRVLAEHRRRGLGERLYGRALGRARELGARVVETCVLESNEDGLRFALKHGFEEIERYRLDGDTATWIDLRLV
ncbi:N-acetyltransferase family protein [Streptomyces sp. NPDC002643]